MRSFLSIYLGAGVRYLYFRYIRRNKKSFKTILNGDGKDSDRDFRERLKNGNDIPDYTNIFIKS